MAIIEPSDIIFEGLSSMILKSGNHTCIYRANNLDELNLHFKKVRINTVIINPINLANQLSDFTRLKKSNNQINWIGLIYMYFDLDLLSKFDDTIYINDHLDTISLKINRNNHSSEITGGTSEELSERETEVLALLVKGMSNKEIAEKLFISIHTVISHRKNISEKTGIKSLPGLTIFAISKKIIPFEAF